MTTIEIVVDDGPWTPPDGEMVFVEVEFGEYKLRGRLKALGAIWNPEIRCWETDRATAKALGITDRICDVRPQS